MTTRTETDSMGPIEVPSDVYWGAQTQRSIDNFDIGRDTFVWGHAMISALGVLKKAAAQANAHASLYAEAAADPIAFWERAAARLDWAPPWHTAHTWEPPVPVTDEHGAETLSVPKAEAFPELI